MVSVELYFRSREDSRFFSDLIKREFSPLTGEPLWIREGSVGEDCDQVDSGEVHYPDLIVYGLDKEEDIAGLILLRKHYPGAELLIAAGADLSASDYVLPQIRPAALVIRPFEESGEAVRRMLTELLKNRMESGRSMMIRTGKTEFYLPWTSVLCIEARDRILYAHCEKQTISFYGTLRDMEKELPPTFFRCHRSFVVHMINVESISLATSSLVVRGGMVIPVSRRCGRLLKKRMAGLSRDDNRKKEKLTP